MSKQYGIGTKIHRTIEKDRVQKKAHFSSQLSMTKEEGIYNGEKTCLFNKWC